MNMMNIKLLIIGNYSAGKTRLVELIHKSWLKFDRSSIDKCRQRYGDGTFSNEFLSWSKFFEEIEYSKISQIIEFSGAGPKKHAIREALMRSDTKTIVIFLNTNLEICRERCQERVWDTPYPWKIDPLEVLEKIDNELHLDWENGFWKEFVSFRSNSYEDILNFLEVEIND